MAFSRCAGGRAHASVHTGPGTSAHDNESGVTYGMAQTKAEAAVMEQTAAKFEQVNDSLQSMLKGLMSELEGLQTAWQGLGAKSFHQVKAQWMADQKVMSVALAETAKAIRASGSGYSATDSESASRVSRTGRSIDLPL